MEFRPVEAFKTLLGLQRAAGAETTQTAQGSQPRALAFGADPEAYHGASYSRKSTRGWHAAANDANAETLPAKDTLLARGRDLVRNAPVARAATNRLKTCVVGTGLEPSPVLPFGSLEMEREQAAAWQRSAKELFKIWAENAVAFDAAGRLNFYQAQAQIMANVFQTGEVFVLLPMVERPGQPIKTKIKIVEAEFCSSPNNMDTAAVTAGLELDSWGFTQAIWLTNAHPKSGKVLEWKRTPVYGGTSGRRQVLHIMEQDRPGQLRGISWLTPVMEKLKQLDRYTDAELMAAVVQGMFTVFIKRPQITAEDGLLEAPLADGEGVQTDGTDIQLGNGAVVGLAEGEEIQTANPSRPNPVYENFVNSIYREIGSALGIPYEVLLQSFQGSYSAARAAFMEGWRYFKERRQWLVAAFCQPVYEAFLDEAIAAGYLQAPGYFENAIKRQLWLNCRWQGDAQGQIDPLKEVQANAMAVEKGFKTFDQVAAEQGEDWLEVTTQLAHERETRRNLGLEVEPQPDGAGRPVNAETPPAADAGTDPAE